MSPGSCRMVSQWPVAVFAASQCWYAGLGRLKEPLAASGHPTLGWDHYITPVTQTLSYAPTIGNAWEIPCRSHMTNDHQ